MTNTINYQKVEKEADNLPTVGFKKLNEEAILPTKAHNEDSGFDLYALEDTFILPGQTVIIKTGMAVDLPEGYDATIRPRSGITAKTKLRVQLGTIDNGYTGELGVIMDSNKVQTAILGEIAKDFFGILSKKIAGNSLELAEIKEDVNKAIDTTLNSHIVDTLQGVETVGESYPVGTTLIKKGDKIAQLVVHPYYDKGAFDVKEITDTERGGNGFGSTGVSNE